jgi:hypothetical protein
MGYISKKGEIVITPQFDVSSYLGVPQFSEFSEGMAAIKSKGLIGYIDSSGDFVVAPQFKDGRKFSSGLAAVKVGDRWGFIDQKGALRIAPRGWPKLRLTGSVGISIKRVSL